MGSASKAAPDVVPIVLWIALGASGSLAEMFVVLYGKRIHHEPVRKIWREQPLVILPILIITSLLGPLQWALFLSETRE